MAEYCRSLPTVQATERIVDVNRRLLALTGVASPHDARKPFPSQVKTEEAFDKLVLGCIEAADELSTSSTVSIGIFPRAPVGLHFELDTAAVWTGCVLDREGPQAIGGRRDPTIAG